MAIFINTLAEAFAAMPRINIIHFIKYRSSLQCTPLRQM
ncbi:hypothetical protein VCJ_000700 [Vibrio metoecus]|nr:hypothetical protein VCJ_000700 [Vibrio metoecus]